MAKDRIVCVPSLGIWGINENVCSVRAVEWVWSICKQNRLDRSNRTQRVTLCLFTLFSTTLVSLIRFQKRRDSLAIEETTICLKVYCPSRLWTVHCRFGVFWYSVWLKQHRGSLKRPSNHHHIKSLIITNTHNFTNAHTFEHSRKQMLRNFRLPSSATFPRVGSNRADHEKSNTALTDLRRETQRRGTGGARGGRKDSAAR